MNNGKAGSSGSVGWLGLPERQRHIQAGISTAPVGLNKGKLNSGLLQILSGRHSRAARFPDDSWIRSAVSARALTSMLQSHRHASHPTQSSAASRIQARVSSESDQNQPSWQKWGHRGRVVSLSRTRTGRCARDRLGHMRWTSRLPVRG